MLCRWHRPHPEARDGDRGESFRQDKEGGPQGCGRDGGPELQWLDPTPGFPGDLALKRGPEPRKVVPSAPNPLPQHSGLEILGITRVGGGVRWGSNLGGLK